MANTELATLAGGCFWCLEAAFQELKGVLQVQSGYAGGRIPHPSYEDVCTGATGHAEVVEVDFDSEKVAYGQLLDAFFELHDPTQLNRQGPDWGTQYRSAIFFHNAQQEAAAKASKESLEKARRYSKPIVTQIVPAEKFFEAEDYHQQYLEKRGLASCHIRS